MCPRGRLGKESSSGEAGRPASPSAEVRMSFEARRAGAFTLDQPIYRRRRGGPAAHRDLRRPGPEDMSRALRARDRPVSLANSRLERSGSTPAAQTDRYTKKESSPEKDRIGDGYGSPCLSSTPGRLSNLAALPGRHRGRGGSIPPGRQGRVCVVGTGRGVRQGQVRSPRIARMARRCRPVS